VRTYEDTKITFLEVKNKNNHKRTNKKRIEVRAVDSLHDEQERVIPFLGKHAWYTLDSIRPVIENRFNRITLVNFGKTERLTIDFNLQFHHLKSDGRHRLQRVAVIELKRDGNVYSPVCNLLRDIHVHPTGFSKCCIGMALTDPDLKQNNFKPKLRHLEKINGRKFIDHEL
jgi:hypothetical protein